jgi:hypothetical protein
VKAEKTRKAELAKMTELAETEMEVKMVRAELALQEPQYRVLRAEGLW